jgi:hypothetical protein
VVLALRSDPEVTAAVDVLHVSVTRDGGDGFARDYAVATDLRLPGTLDFYEDPPSSSPVTFEVTGSRAGQLRIVERAILVFPAEKTKLLRFRMEAACLDVRCQPGQTCRGGECVSANIPDPEGLPDFTSNEDANAGDAGAGGAGHAGTSGLGGASGGGQGNAVTGGKGGSSGVGGSGASAGKGGGGNGGGAGGGGQSGSAGAAGAGGASGAGGGAGTGGAAGKGAGGAGGTGGVGGASAGSAGQGGKGGIGGSGGAAGGPVEDCFDGIDDDGDKLVDCADPDCAGVVACSLALPNGFLGPFAYWTGATGSEPGCPAAYPTLELTGTTGLSCTAATCPCSCNAPTGVACSSPAVFWNNTVTCPNGNGPTQASGGCLAPNVSNPNHATVFGGGSLPSGGSCTAKPGTKVTTPPTWATTGVLCGAPLVTGGCAAGASCAPPLPPSFAMCVYAAGDVACPASDYVNKQVLYGGVDDTRGCSTCTCGAATGGSCKQTFDVWGNTTCSGAPAATFSGSCAPVANVTRFGFTPAYQGGATCPPMVSTTGGCAPKAATAVTVCCAP